MCLGAFPLRKWAYVRAHCRCGLALGSEGVCLQLRGAVRHALLCVVRTLSRTSSSPCAPEMLVGPVLGGVPEEELIFLLILAVLVDTPLRESLHAML